MQINGHKISLGNVLTVLGMLGGLAAVWVALSVDAADTKRRLTTAEQRQAEDRTETKEKLKDVDQKVERIDTNVNTILRKLDAMDAERRAERRERR